MSSLLPDVVTQTREYSERVSIVAEKSDRRQRRNCMETARCASNGISVTTTAETLACVAGWYL